ncbi:hypothetical protein CALVIDRAFT_599545 [Calocera viscosa TUFC12733]|uniref:Uncharacterized protein n=1 Tax=Calocera viscosa (strain TUFC12733) TaxID=1330018 RepID=A0A167KM78_CALVF|nr:hypothetical protein CALVIDRAFT_599545 [Calocera viscosa TUFC12733]
MTKVAQSPERPTQKGVVQVLLRSDAQIRWPRLLAYDSLQQYLGPLPALVERDSQLDLFGHHVYLLDTFPPTEEIKMRLEAHVRKGAIAFLTLAEHSPLTKWEDGEWRLIKDAPTASPDTLWSANNERSASGYSVGETTPVTTDARMPAIVTPTGTGKATWGTRERLLPTSTSTCTIGDPETVTAPRAIMVTAVSDEPITSMEPLVEEKPTSSTKWTREELMIQIDRLIEECDCQAEECLVLLLDAAPTTQQLEAATRSSISANSNPVIDTQQPALAYSSTDAGSIATTGPAMHVAVPAPPFDDKQIAMTVISNASNMLQAAGLGRENAYLLIQIALQCNRKALEKGVSLWKELEKGSHGMEVRRLDASEIEGLLSAELDPMELDPPTSTNSTPVTPEMQAREDILREKCKQLLLTRQTKETARREILQTCYERAATIEATFDNDIPAEEAQFLINRMEKQHLAPQLMDDFIMEVVHADELAAAKGLSLAKVLYEGHCGESVTAEHDEIEIDSLLYLEKEQAGDIDEVDLMRAVI